MTPIAAEGLELVPPLDQLVGVNANEIAAQIVRLHGDSNLSFSARHAGIKLVQERFSGSIVEEMLGAAIEGRRPT
jgi:hypothetical protein